VSVAPDVGENAPTGKSVAGHEQKAIAAQRFLVAPVWVDAGETAWWIDFAYRSGSPDRRPAQAAARVNLAVNHF
jgi:hypothetical protein